MLEEFIPLAIPRDARALRQHIVKILEENNKGACMFPRGIRRSSMTSAVLFLLGRHPSAAGGRFRPCIVLNKRSGKVRQPGDLCFPGGRVAARLDPFLSRLLKLPFLPLGRWPHRVPWYRQRPQESRRLELLLATSLRESLEEMRLNPLGIRFLGPLPSENLEWFHRILYPMVGWISRQRHFFPNWEVEEIIHVPLAELLKPKNYACYRLRFEGRKRHGSREVTQDFPCFLHQRDKGSEVLWGVTYRIVMVFLRAVFAFTPPALESLPVVNGTVAENYYK